MIGSLGLLRPVSADDSALRETGRSGVRCPKSAGQCVDLHALEGCSAIFMRWPSRDYRDYLPRQKSVTANEQPEQPYDEKPSLWDWARWAFAFAIAVGALLFFLGVVGSADVCHGVVAGPDQNPQIKTVCDPPRMLELVPFFLLIGLLLWPDLSEIGIGGMITLKRRVREQEKRLAETEDRVSTLHQTLLQTLSVQQTQKQANTVNVSFAPDQDDVARNIRESQVPQSPEQTAEPSPESDDRDRLLGQFLDLYARLEPYVQFATGQNRRRYQGRIWYEDEIERLTPRMRDGLEQWSEQFAEPIRALKDTRNVAVHSPSRVSTETLQKAIDNAGVLQELLYRLMGEFNAIDH